MASEPPDSSATPPGYELVQHGAYVDVALRGRPRLEMVVAMFGDLERLTSTGGELLVLLDESEMNATLLRPSELRAMIDAWKGFDGLRERSRIAIYAPSNVNYGLNRMAQAFAGKASEGRLEVFRTKEAAKDWLRGEQRVSGGHSPD
jgi:hypothetical protein